MPIYEFRCQECRRKSSFLVLSVRSQFERRCQHCGSPRLVRLISRVGVLRSEESRLESLADPSRLGDLDEKDPKSIARWMKKLGREVGEELGPDFEEEVDRAVEEAEQQQAGEGGGSGPDDTEP
ncbi:MAG: zinc ribbon domain-containing protein [Candidatus Saccharicenans sp.]|jgi:putative FmdB family regulatory protein|nr:zinc ribbon domain-containing protein [Candidatus Saccharicenans sp.]MDH7493788.1 zinc ribbon domain-containing protein [Candidatus Saccharicenans sp.]